MKTTSNITGLQYEPGHDTVYITNMVQARLLDILYDNTKNDALVFVFSKSETKELYDRWNNRDLR